ncbi:NAD+ synthase [Alkalilimnicola ehrlichii MLHE-1]|uniref:Glutamine-dependent NAD(+) synthetase n=1 Tax=Alkalilimnicola ehrlichii (strain ATCC BAA-1101 / DSM 17681 / MLHE-1) TaxID=187272 RepID=Q0A5J8_ALKEH|nr:NAD+ synthase [Alkalilimnicola ehrlichii]ABI57889.1 DNA-directed RNA polymerase, subunit H [Alkalilimnicola ehrlichii MLHE-1]
MSLRVTMAQLTCPVGDIEGNTRRIVGAIETARDREGAQLVVFPELAVTGYPPDDLLLRDDFTRAAENALQAIQAASRGVTAVVGVPLRDRRGLHNAAVVVQDGRVIARYAKRELPTYSVFDDSRHFVAGDSPCVVDVAGTRVGLSICEDIWWPTPAREAVAAGAEFVVNLNASPFHRRKQAEREAVLRERALDTHRPLLYVNMVGGHDEVVYDGGSLAVDAGGTVQARAPRFRSGLCTVEVDTDHGNVNGEQSTQPSEEGAVYQALVTGLRDYVQRNGFPGVVLGLSGGIDSAVAAAVAVDALGADRVQAVMMPSRYTAPMSLDDAQAIARMLGIRYQTTSIEPIFQSFLSSLAPSFEGLDPDVTEENLQSRIRGTLLMALSNKTGRMVLACGNKSELAVGYATLYGDMCGGYAPLKDVYKTEVYRLARYRQSLKPAFPDNIFSRPPTAELAAGQKDEDSLPPYPVLDDILERYVEHDESEALIVAAGHEPATVAQVTRLLRRNEYKRRQSAPGPKVTPRAFGRDRRYPISSGWPGVPVTS